MRGNSLGLLPHRALSWHQDLGEKGIEQAAAGGAGGVEARLQPIAKRYQLIDLDDDAVLFGEGWEGKRHSRDGLRIEVRECDANRFRFNVRRSERIQVETEICREYAFGPLHDHKIGTIRLRY